MCSNNGGVDFIVMKINGVDISQSPKCEAVQTFLKTKETIVIELCRQKSEHDDNSLNIAKLQINATTGVSKLANNSVSVSSDEKTSVTSFSHPNCILGPELCGSELVLTLQTHNFEQISDEQFNITDDPTHLKDITSNELTFATRGSQTEERAFNIVNNSTHSAASVVADRFTEQEHHLFEQCLEPEIDIEEITLSKAADSKERLGLTICYSGTCSNSGNSVLGVNTTSNNNNINVACALSSSDDNETCAEVFISDIQPKSVAERDGRLRRGDQILQINGKDIKSREDTELLMAENNNSVTLLVSRYLYPEDDATDDEDDDDEYYVDSNLEYANGFIVNDYTNVVDKLDKTLIPQPKGTENDFIESTTLAVLEETIVPTVINDVIGLPLKIKDESIITKTSEQTLKRGYDTKVTVISEKNELNTTVKLSLGADDTDKKSLLLTEKNNAMSCDKTSMASVKKYQYDETEHIYETIPEDSESEPFYCSPYQSSTYMTAVGSCSSATTNDALELQQQKQRVAQWLGIKSNAVSMHMIATTSVGRSALHGNRLSASLSQRNANKIGTLRSALTSTTSGSSSSGAGYSGCGQVVSLETANSIDEVENSSSAYNTGCSNNSASPLALALTKNHHDNEAGLSSTKIRGGSQPAVNKSQRLQSPKDQVITSPKNNLTSFGKTAGNENIVRNKTPVDDQQQFSKAVLYRNESNSSQAGFLQQQQQQYLHTASLQQQRQFDQTLISTQFNAPNLSQYHFVSSQEVATANVNLNSPLPKISTLVAAHKNGDEEATPMVWKVKRRPDGTRYIVKRPARNRLPVTIRKNIRNNDITTTEDDTISEVKIGRYWTKEERKRHIERARERRNQQQQQTLH